MDNSPSTNPLDLFLPAIRKWFETTLGIPTPPQAQAWPAIQRGENILVLAPTGSGKTLTAFLWAIDRLFHERIANSELRITNPTQPAPRTTKKSALRIPHSAFEVVYLSPLKALNNDVECNLNIPLAGIRRTADRLNEQMAAEDGSAECGIRGDLQGRLDVYTESSET